MNHKWIVLVAVLLLLCGCGVQAAEPAESIRLELEETAHSLDAESIPFALVNTTGEDVLVVPVPSLERKTGDSWEWVPSNLGGCGIPDPAGERLEGSLLLSWYDGLEPGTYRLRMDIYRDYADHQGEPVLSEEFMLQ